MQSRFGILCPLATNFGIAHRRAQTKVDHTHNGSIKLIHRTRKCCRGCSRLIAHCRIGRHNHCKVSVFADKTFADGTTTGPPRHRKFGIDGHDRQCVGPRLAGNWQNLLND